MIRFWDTDIFVVQKRDIDRTFVRRHFFSEGHMDDILAVYDDSEYCGIVTYDSFLSSADGEDEESYIFSRRYVHTPGDEHMWQDLKEILKEQSKENVFMPVLSARGEILYFAYEDGQEENGTEQGYINSTLDCMEKMEDKILQAFFSAAYPKVRGVRIYNLNEWGYRFCKIMERCGYYVETFGEKWEVLYPHMGGEEQGKTFLPETAFMNVYAEGNAFIRSGNISKRAIDKTLDMYWWRDVLRGIGANFYNWTEQKFIQNCKGVCFIKVTVPQKHEIAFKLNGEEDNDFYMPHVFDDGSAEDIAYCQKVYGRDITLEEWNELNETKKTKPRYSPGYGAKIKCFCRKQKAGRKLYVVGPCIVGGGMVPEDKETFLYCLYEALKEMGMEYDVVGVVAAQFGELENYRNILDSLTVCEADVVIAIRNDFGTYSYPEGEKLDLKKVYETREEYWFYDMPIHTNYAGNRGIAKAVAEYISLHVDRAASNTRGEVLRVGKRRLSRDEHELLEQYIQQVQGRGNQSRLKKVGAIVMNCNPMTKGHLHLIETARKSVDYLYVFVVEEDRSDIPFAERYAMVQAQTREMADVHVVPSGRFILSYETMPLYFEKAKKQEAVLDAADDLQIFCQYIAPRLGITKRFVGEEPTDKVTRQYNEEMKRILPYYGITLTEIPRLESGGSHISASAVRKLAGQGDWESVGRLMPKEAYKIYRKGVKNKV